jgi:hypothetical protein
MAALSVAFVLVGTSQAATVSSVAPYVDMGASPTPVLSTMASQGGVKSFTLGFVTSYGCTNITQQPYEFSKIFAGFNG